MNTYNVIEISTGNIIIQDSTYEDCLQWIEEFGDIINYTIVQNN
jgi:hypothetical protein